MAEQPLFTVGVSEMGPFLDFARGDPRLSSWEESFLASLAHRRYEWGDRIKLSEKQVGVLTEVATKLRWVDGADQPVPLTEEAADLELDGSPVEDEAHAATLTQDDDEVVPSWVSVAANQFYDGPKRRSRKGFPPARPC